MRAALPAALLLQSRPLLLPLWSSCRACWQQLVLQELRLRLVGLLLLQQQHLLLLSFSLASRASWELPHQHQHHLVLLQAQQSLLLSQRLLLQP